MNSNVKSIIKKYYFQCFGIWVLCMSITCFLLFGLDSIWGIITLIPVLFITRLIVKSLQDTNFLSVLYCELNPQKFKDVIEGAKFFVPSIGYQVFAAYYSGDYQTTINICTKKLLNEKKCKNKCFYLVILARVYFLLGDNEKLKMICKQFQNYIMYQKRVDQIRKQYVVMQYFEKYLEGDYLSCQDYYSMYKDNTKAVRSELRQIQWKFYYAVACYYADDKETAQQIFGEVISEAPKVNYANISQKYLNIIEKNQQESFAKIEMLPDENYIVPTDKIFSKWRVGVVFSYILIGVCIIISVFINGSSLHKPSIVEGKLNSALDKEYEEYKLLDYFNINKDDSIIAAMCVAEIPEERLDVCSVGVNDDDENFELSNVIKDVQIGKYYYIKDITDMYYIGFSIVDEKKDIPPNSYKIVEIGLGKNSMFFYVDYIERTLPYK